MVWFYSCTNIALSVIVNITSVLSIVIALPALVNIIFVLLTGYSSACPYEYHNLYLYVLKFIAYQIYNWINKQRTLKFNFISGSTSTQICLFCIYISLNIVHEWTYKLCYTDLYEMVKKRWQIYRKNTYLKLWGCSKKPHIDSFIQSLQLS